MTRESDPPVPFTQPTARGEASVRLGAHAVGHWSKVPDMSDQSEQGNQTDQTAGDGDATTKTTTTTTTEPEKQAGEGSGDEQKPAE